MEYRLGIDVGGTNTDAVILDTDDRVVSKAKYPTTRDVSTGIMKAVELVLRESRIDPGDIVYAMLGTTHSTNAIVERKGLEKVGVIRLGAPAGVAAPPFVDWPEEMLRYIGGIYRIVKGGFEYNGKLISSPDRDEIKSSLKEMKSKGIGALAISCVFSPVNNEHELFVREIAQEIFGGDFPISLSCEIGSIGILERENATILNAAISKLASSAYNSFKNVLRTHKIYADLYITQNDGTLMSVDYACQYPVFTIASGPTNSLRGAAFLSRISDAVVVDVGGTTTDVGILRNGFPRESTSAIEIGGVRTNFRMPDLISIGLGGGSIVAKKNNGVRVGPESVGYRIIEEAIVFGGKTLTATDCAVAMGLASIGNQEKVKDVDTKIARRACERIKEMVEEIIDRMKTTSEDVQVVLVGGGSILLPAGLKGASSVFRPEHFDVANAIGAAISQISGSIDGVFDVATKGRSAVVEEVKEAAIREAIRAGADESSIEIVELEEIPLSYLPSNAVRFKVKAVGNLRKKTTRG